MNFLRTSVLVAAVLAVQPMFAQAQGLQILKVSKFGSEAKPAQPVFTDARLFQTALDKGYNNNRATLENNLRLYLGQGNLFAPGITLYNINVRLGQANFRFLSNNQFEITMNGNYMYAKSTTPSDFGSYADPAAQLVFDVRVSGRFEMPTKAQPTLRIREFAVNFSNAKVTGRNIVGNIGVAVANIFRKQIQTYLGKEIDKVVKGPVNAQLTAALTVANRAITPLFQQNYLGVDARINGQFLVITMTHSTSLLPPGPPVLKYDPTLPVVR